jgi:hypothetical protein
MDRFTARRKLLRGSLAAPVVLTTASPAVLAQTSFLACITRGGNEGATPFADEQCGGNVYRIEVDVFQFVPTAGGDPYGNGKLFALREGTTDRYDATDGSEQDIPVPKDHEPKKVGTSWKLVYFNENGEEVGYGFVSNNGTPVSCSCWTSFNFKPL